MLELSLLSPVKSIKLHQFPVIIGRGTNGDIVSLDDSSIGHYQCMIDRDIGGFMIWDLGTQVGTIINGQRINKNTPLQHGDKITIGDNSFTALIGVSP
jgi:pSer/pThr/pTyr-binding forkhead associated (FHA) protein